jgi:hypothetical protein
VADSILDRILALNGTTVEQAPLGPRWGPVTPGQKAALERSIAQRAAERKARRKAPAIERMVVLMMSGKFYSAGDLARAIGGGRGEARRLEDTLRQRGLVVRRRNAAWPGKRIGAGRTWRLYEPKWLYRLTDAGEAFRNLCVLVT